MSNSIEIIKFMLLNEPHLKKQLKELLSDKPKPRRMTKKERDAKRFENCYTMATVLF